MCDIHIIVCNKLFQVQQYLREETLYLPQCIYDMRVILQNIPVIPIWFIKYLVFVMGTPFAPCAVGMNSCI
jgi:hypothetical protein